MKSIVSGTISNSSISGTISTGKVSGTISTGSNSIVSGSNSNDTVSGNISNSIVSGNIPKDESLQGQMSVSNVSTQKLNVDDTLRFDEHGVLGVNTTNEAEADNTLPITSAGVHTQIGNIEILLGTI